MALRGKPQPPLVWTDFRAIGSDLKAGDRGSRGRLLHPGHDSRARTRFDDKILSVRLREISFSRVCRKKQGKKWSRLNGPRVPRSRGSCRVIYAWPPTARSRRGPHADRIRQSDIKLDVRLPDVIASRPPAALLERPTDQRAPLKCVDERAPVAARSARVVD